MKAIAIYSGKGGVGKTTVAALFALSLSKKYKVVLMDLDINTPSIPVIFGGKEKIGNLYLFSVGYYSDRPLTFTGKIARKVLTDMSKEAKELKPDVIIMDMPPGTGDVQLETCLKLKPSSFVLVVQPNRLSQADANRATQLFMETKVPIVGMIENMTGEIFGKTKSIEIMGLPVLATVNLREDIAKAGSKGTIDTIKSNPFDKLAESIYKESTEINWTTSKNAFYEGLDAEKYFGTEDEKTDLKRKKYEFIGLKSWDYVREQLMNQQGSSVIPLDRTLLLNDTETIRRMLEGLDESNQGLFMVIRAPSTQIKLFPGEIGSAHLYREGKYYYNLPRVAYETDEGEIVLFPHEVSPVDTKLLTELQKKGEIVLAPNSKTPRYVPLPKLMKEIKVLYGSMVGNTHGIEKEYKKLGIPG